MEQNKEAMRQKWNKSELVNRRHDDDSNFGSSTTDINTYEDEIADWWLAELQAERERIVAEMGKINFLEDITGEKNRHKIIERYRKLKDLITPSHTEEN